MYNIGDLVEIINTNLIGKIIRKNNNIYTIKIIPNSSILKTSEDKIRLSNKKIDNKNSVNIKYTLNSDDFNEEIMLRHQTVEVALYNLDVFISDAIAHRAKRVRIIHGRHGGILRKAVHKYLSSSPYIDKYQLADYFEGSYGVTIAYLKDKNWPHM